MNRQIILIITFLTLSILKVNGQQISPEKLGFKSYSIRDKNLGAINYYITSNKIDTKKPVLIYLDGSGAYPLFQLSDKGIGSSVAIDYRNLSDDYHVVLISKPAIPFIDTVKTDVKSGIPLYDATSEYDKKLSLDWRVSSAKMVLHQIIKDVKVDKRKIAVMGISEGFQVGAKLATVENSFTHLILLVGNGLNQFYDFIIQNRVDALNGVISSEQAQINIDSLMMIAKEIYANPKETNKKWYGHTFMRWSNFTSNNPTENILSLNIPVYIVAASNDRNTAVLGTDYLYLESIRMGKTNIEYKVYPLDHSFNEYIKDESGMITSVKNHMQAIIGESLEWLRKN